MSTRLSCAAILAGLVALVATVSPAATSVPELEGTSPGEKAAIETLCGSEHSAIARQMCMVNQVVSLSREARKADLSVASPDQRQAIERACAAKAIPAERFACERTQLAKLGLGVRDEPGGGRLNAEETSPAAIFSPGGAPAAASIASPTGFPTFSLEKWRAERPPMPPATGAGSMSPQVLYDHIAQSVYIVVASDQPVEVAERVAHAQGSAVAISNHVLLTNCHVLTGRPNIRITQQGRSGRASLIYADPAGDRCFIKADDFEVHPVAGVRRFADIHVGETVFSLGTPQGLELSFGEGLVSGLRVAEGVRMIQNSAPSWHGSSGGGLFDVHGNLIGITTAGSSTVANLNFSIAAEDFWP